MADEQQITALKAAHAAEIAKLEARHVRQLSAQVAPELRERFEAIIDAISGDLALERLALALVQTIQNPVNACSRAGAVVSCLSVAQWLIRDVTEWDEEGAAELSALLSVALPKLIKVKVTKGHPN
jgi:hypothetical protein